MEKKLLSIETARQLKVVSENNVSVRFPTNTHPHIITSSSDYEDGDTVELVLLVAYQEGGDVEGFVATSWMSVLTIFKLYVFDLENFKTFGEEVYVEAVEAAINDAGTLRLYREDGRPRASLEVGLQHFTFDIDNDQGRKCFNW